MSGFVIGAILAAAVMIAAGVGMFLAYGPWRLTLGEIESLERGDAIPVPSTEAMGGDPLEAAFALDTMPPEGIVAP